MFRLLRLFVLASSALVLVACAAVPEVAPPGTAARVKRVAPVSVLGNVFARQVVGLTAFGNEYEEMPIGGWGVDSEYEAQLAAAAERTLGATAVRAPYNAADFAVIADGDAWSRIEAPARALCAANSLDALFVVTRSRAARRALGSYTRGTTSTLMFDAQIALVDCTSGKPIVLRRLAVPTAPLARDVAVLPLAKWATEMVDKVGNDVKSMPRDFWAPTLAAMFAVRK